MNFSVLMSIYKNETIDNFITAMDSVLNQTLMPDEIILMRDGPVSEKMQNVIDDYVKKHAIITYCPLDENKGLGEALRRGVRKARNDIIARMDTDDFALPNRFELQIEYAKAHPDVSVWGGQIEEFIGDISNIVGKREVPTEHEDICRFMKKRNSFNHMTVMFRRQDVLDAGNYKELFLVEDYYLWCRMLVKGYRFGNLPEVVVYARTSEDMYQRRGGYKYFKSWKAIEQFKLENGITNLSEYTQTLAMRFAVQVLMPNRVRGFVLKKFSRKQNS